MIVGAFFKALGQMPERAMLRPLVLGVIVTAVLILVIGLCVGWLASTFLPGVVLPGLGEIGGGAAEAAGLAAGVAAIAALAFAFTPAAALAVGFFVDPVAEAVEAKHYPTAPVARGRSFMTEIATAARYAGLAVLINLPLLPFYILFPPLPAFANGWLLARAFFDMAALRRETGREARDLRRRARGSILLAGAIMALLSLIPFLNLVAPVFGLAMMTHVYHGARRGGVARPGARA